VTSGTVNEVSLLSVIHSLCLLDDKTFDTKNDKSLL